jgi:hypothetical protein
MIITPTNDKPWVLPNISLDRTGDAGRVWRECCMLRMAWGQGGEWPRPISSRALGSYSLSRSLLDYPNDAGGITHGLAETCVSRANWTSSCQV